MYIYIQLRVQNKYAKYIKNKHKEKFKMKKHTKIM